MTVGDPPSGRLRLDLHGVDIAHSRLPELAKLADAARPFYDWVEGIFLSNAPDATSLSECLLTQSFEDIERSILTCYRSGEGDGVPALFDGVGRQYPHRKACYYFLAWLLRDAPQQRLLPMLARASKNSPAGVQRLEIQAEALATLFIAYRGALGTFSWDAIREVVMDRLEGSRRSIKGHMQEVVVRTAISAALQAHFDANGNYGRFKRVAVANGEIRVGNETFDVSVLLEGADGYTERILIPVKSRETEGGGHSHLFTRDINSAINAVRSAGSADWIVAFIIAQNWAPREREHVASVCDYSVSLEMSPTAFDTLLDSEQRSLDEFVSHILIGSMTQKVRAT